MMPTHSLPARPVDTPPLDPDHLEHCLLSLVAVYQCRRAAPNAQAIARCVRSLIGHPDYEGSDEDRCAYRRLARQWDWLARHDADHATQADAEAA